MKPLIFLGDEAGAAGFRLAGLAVRVPAAGHEAEAFAEALAEAGMLIVGAACAARLPAAAVTAALDAGEPAVLVLPGRAGALPAGDPALAVRQLLGVSR